MDNWYSVYSPTAIDTRCNGKYVIDVGKKQKRFKVNEKQS